MTSGDVPEKRTIVPCYDWKTFLEEGKEEFYKIYSSKLDSKQHKRGEFDFIKTIGTGAYGRVYLTSHHQNGKYYAIKLLDKEQIVNNKQVSHTINERNILLALNFPFCVYLEMSFQDNSFVYMCLPFIRGGEMFTHLQKARRFTENIGKFYGAQILLAFEYLHYMNLIYRDLKPENVLVDTNGYLKLTDFGFCKNVTGRTYTLCGTPEYLAPEVIANKGYGRSVDWWAYGVFLYEMSAGMPPFEDHDPMRIFEKINACRYRIPSFFSDDLTDLLHNLIQVDLSKRYGNLVNGVKDIKDHPWFKEMNWLALFNGTLTPPYLPKVVGEDDTSNFIHYKEITMRISNKDRFSKEFSNF